MTVNKYDIYIGSKHSDTSDTAEELSVIQRCICEYMSETESGFSVTHQTGGYLHSNGAFIVEDSILISITGTDDKTVKKLAKRLKRQFCQESVLVVKTKSETRYA